jgi:Tol biopolymer transport system component
MWTVSLLNGSIRKLWDIEGAAAMSPDESHIALVGVMQGRRGIWLARADSLQLENVLTTDNYIVAFSWSPNGRRFAYIRSPFFSTDAWLESRDLHGQNVTTVLEDGRLFSSSTHAGLCWLPDGRLIFSRQEDPPNSPDSNLWAIKADPDTGRTKGKPYRLTHFNDFVWTNLSVSRDGKRLIALKTRLVSSIYMGEFNAEGTRLRFIHRLTTDNWSYSIGGWTPVSDAVLLHGRHLGQYQIYKQTLDKQAPEALFSSTKNYFWPEYSPDKSWILFWSSETDTLHQPLHLMRLARNGGTPEVVLTASPNSSFHCGRLGKTCVLRENRTGKAVFSVLDPLQGKGRCSGPG